ncbi:MAG: PIN domain-containing protein [Actinobacteria bacterium]|nr:PIN domain-containing protein [Actinomycetota bacterium]
MIAVDSSVVIAAFASWHERHHAATAVLKRDPRLVAHAAVETYSVLTRLPPPHRAEATLVEEFLRQRFGTPLLCLPERRHRDLITTMAKAQILGGRIYDAMIGLTAAEHGATLITLDHRAALIYDMVGASTELPGA